MTVQGVPVFDSLALAYLEITFIRDQLNIVARGSFVDSKTGVTHGTTRTYDAGWSTATLTKLGEFKEALERDIARQHFGSVSEMASPKGLRVEGIGEHLGTDGEVPSV